MNELSDILFNLIVSNWPKTCLDYEKAWLEFQHLEIDEKLRAQQAMFRYFEERKGVIPMLSKYLTARLFDCDLIINHEQLYDVSNEIADILNSRHEELEWNQIKLIKLFLEYLDRI